MAKSACRMPPVPLPAENPLWCIEMNQILISTLALVLVSLVIADGRDITVGPGGDYSKIQDAIDDPDTRDGDIIWVMSGVYYENITVNKTISLEGWNTNNGYPTVDAGNGSESAITLSADGIILESLKVRNSKNAGIDVKSSDNQIVDIGASKNKYGILLEPSSSGNYIRSSNAGSTTVSDNNFGIYMDSSNYNNIERIKASDNNYGIYLKSSGDNDINGNNLVNNKKNDAYDDSTDDNTNFWGGNGGNHYSDYDKSSEGCKNPDDNGVCDAPYVIPGGKSQDDNPVNKANKINIPDRKDKEHTRKKR
jgi:parallel beta-helix repeat protein